MTSRIVQTVPVECATCGRRMQGHPCNNGFYAVSRHLDRVTGKRCRGFWRYALPIHTREAVAS